MYNIVLCYRKEDSNLRIGGRKPPDIIPWLRAPLTGGSEPGGYVRSPSVSVLVTATVIVLSLSRLIDRYA